MTYKLAIFDFDGTLADSFPFFASVFNDLARRHGFRTVEPEEVAPLRQLGAREIMRYLGLPVSKLPLVASDFIRRMRERRDAIALFPGIADLLPSLDRAGVEVAIVSSNAHDNVVSILGPSRAAAVKSFSCGMSIFGKRAHLRKVLKQCGVAAASAIYIGDQASDLEAAHAEQIAFGAVSWGYGDVQNLKARGADHTFGCVDDITRLLLESRASK